MASAKSDNKNDEEKMEETAYNTVFYKHFADYCKDIHKSLAKKEIKKSNKFSKIDKKEVINCGLLSKGVYNASLYSPLLKNTNVDLDSSKAYQSEKNEMTEWGFLVNKETKTGYIVFRGTAGETLGIDVLTDISIVPTPIWCDDDKIIDPKTENKDENKQQDTETKNNDWKDFRKGHNHRWDFAVHGGIYSSVLRVFGLVLNELDKKGNTFNKLYITGHSLGGGLAILFGLELLLRKLIPKHIKTHIVTFGAPYVLSLEYKISTLRPKAAEILTTLHSMTHCFVNKFDIVSRIPSPWILEILLPTIPIIIGGALKDSAWSGWASISSSLMEHFGGGVIDSLKQQFMKHQQMLNTFGPFGTYYIILHDSQSNCYIIDDSADNGTIKQILSFIPPIRKNKGLAIKNTENIFAHYYYKQLLGVTSDALQVKLLMQQRRVQFDKAVWKVQCEFNDMPSQYYNTLQTYLFTQRDLYKLIQDHFMDNYLEGLTAHDCKDKIVLTQLKCLKLFNIGCETHTGDKIWENVDKGKYSWNSKTCGSLRVQSRIYNQFFSKFNPNALHSDKYRLTMKSNVFTENKIKDVCHSNDQNVVISEFNRIKQLMEYWES